jgi:hypothetical protein
VDTAASSVQHNDTTIFHISITNRMATWAYLSYDSNHFELSAATVGPWGLTIRHQAEDDEDEGIVALDVRTHRITTPSPVPQLTTTTTCAFTPSLGGAGAPAHWIM